MGINLIIFSFWVSLFFSYYTLFSTALTADNRNSNGSSAPSTQYAPPPLPQNRPNLTPFRPSIAVIVGVLTTMFSITFLLLLYAKHCKRGHVAGGYIGNPSSGAGPAARRNSGIDRAVIETLPIFRFASLRGHKDGLECAVCLTRFEPTEVLRLLPKCKHAFHIECVDTWLDAHSTCPLCRYRVDPEDVLLIDNPKLADQTNDGPSESAIDSTRDSSELGVTEFSRVSGRHSSAGESTSQSQYSLQILVQRPSESEAESRESRRSLDSARKKRERDTVVSVGCFERSARKDGLLLTQPEPDKCRGDRESFMRRFEHRIILSRGEGGGDSGAHRRWSDFRPSDRLFFQSDMIISNSGRYSASSVKQGRNDGSGRSVINARCMSEITGLSRFREK